MAKASRKKKKFRNPLLSEQYKRRKSYLADTSNVGTARSSQHSQIHLRRMWLQARHEEKESRYPQKPQ